MRRLGSFIWLIITILLVTGAIAFTTSNGARITLYLWPFDGELTAPIWLVVLSSFIIVGSALRYDVSILLPDNRRDVIRLSSISFKNVMATVAISIIAVMFLPEPETGARINYYLIPLSILFAGSSLVLTANLNYKKIYKGMAAATFIQTIATLIFNLIFYLSILF